MKWTPCLLLKRPSTFDPPCVQLLRRQVMQSSPSFVGLRGNTLSMSPVYQRATEKLPFKLTTIVAAYLVAIHTIVGVSILWDTRATGILLFSFTSYLPILRIVEIKYIFYLKPWLM